MAKAIFKKIVGEIARSLLGLVQSIVVNYFGSLVTEAIFGELKETIIGMIQKNHEYMQRKENLKTNLVTLETLIDKSTTREILKEKIYEAELEFNDKMNNQILGLATQISGPLSGQIGEAAYNVQYSGLELNEKTKKLENKQSKQLGQIANGISIAVRVLSYTNALYELVTIVNDQISSIDRKISYKTEVVQKTTKEKEKTSQTKNDTNKEEWLDMIDKRIFANIEKKVQTGIVSPTFNIVLSHALKPLYRKLEKSLMGDFNELKKRDLAKGEFNKRLYDNPGEKGVPYNVIKEFLLNELGKLQVFKSPIAETNIDKLPKSGKYHMYIEDENGNGKWEVFDMDKEEDVTRLKNMGSIGLRILPGPPPCISRPSWPNYLKSLLDKTKQLNELDLKMIAEKEKRPIRLVKPDGTLDPKVIGPDNGEEPLYFMQQEGESKHTGHFVPATKNEDGSFTAVTGLGPDLTNKENSCGIETVIYLKEREKFKAAGYSDKEADAKAREILNNPNNNIRENYLKELVTYAYKQPHLFESYVGRQHESSSIIGGSERSVKRPFENITSKIIYLF